MTKRGVLNNKDVQGQIYPDLDSSLKAPSRFKLVSPVLSPLEGKAAANGTSNPRYKYASTSRRTRKPAGGFFHHFRLQIAGPFGYF